MKKQIWLAVEREPKETKGFYVGSRETLSFESLSKSIEHINSKIYASNAWGSYNIINPRKRIVGKTHTYTVERANHLFSFFS